MEDCDGITIGSVDFRDLSKETFGCGVAGQRFECDNRKKAFAESSTISSNFEFTRMNLPQVIKCTIVTFVDVSDARNRRQDAVFARNIFVGSVHTDIETLRQAARALGNIVVNGELSVTVAGRSAPSVASNWVTEPELDNSTTVDPDLNSSTESDRLSKTELSYIIGIAAGLLLCCLILVLVFVERQRSGKKVDDGILVHKHYQPASDGGFDLMSGLMIDRANARALSTAPYSPYASAAYLDTTPYLDIQRRPKPSHFYPGQQSTMDMFYFGSNDPAAYGMETKTDFTPRPHYYPPGGETGGPDGAFGSPLPPPQSSHYYPGSTVDAQPLKATRGTLLPALTAWEAAGGVRPMSPAEFAMREDGYGQDQTWFSGNDQDQGSGNDQDQGPWNSVRGENPARNAARLGSPQQHAADLDYLAMY